jgi:hypothetical protein
MIRPLCLVALLLPAIASAQEAGGYSAGPASSEPRYESRVYSFQPSPEVTQSRLFAGARFWRLDPGQYEVETWWRVRKTAEGTEHLFQAEVEIGLTAHLQLDLYENLQVLPGQSLSQEGNQIEARYSFARNYGELWGNPTLYLEWHPRHHAPDRAEARMLIGGELLPRLMGALNVYVEQNVTDRDGPEGVDGELGFNAAASYGVIDDHLRIGAETKLGLDQHGKPDYVPLVEVGPNILVHAGRFKATATFLFGLEPTDPRYEPFLILGYAL